MTIAVFLIKFHTLLLMFNEPVQKKDTLLSVEPGVMIWTIIIFVILLYILKRFAWKPLLNSLNSREHLITSSVEKAEHLHEEAKKMLEQNKKLLESADDESRKIINEGKQMAEKLRTDLLNKTSEDTKRMILQAKSEIEREKQAAMSELKDEVANLAVQAASRIIDENLNPAKQRKIIEGFIKQMPESRKG